MNVAAAYTSLPDAASAEIPPHRPASGLPSDDQLLPFHLTTFMPLNAYTSLPDTANADTPPIPEPSADQPLPFHLATPLPLAAYISLPDAANADTVVSIPEPS